MKAHYEYNYHALANESRVAYQGEQRCSAISLNMLHGIQAMGADNGNLL